MNRRGFLGGALTLAATAMVDPERLLWTPGHKTIFVPKPAPLRIVGVALWPIGQGNFGYVLASGPCQYAPHKGFFVTDQQQRTWEFVQALKPITGGQAVFEDQVSHAGHWLRLAASPTNGESPLWHKPISRFFNGITFMAPHYLGQVGEDGKV